MSRLLPPCIIMGLFVTMSACGPKPADPQAAAAPAAALNDAGDVDPEDPKAGTNTARPDSIEDVKPEADGAKPPR